MVSWNTEASTTAGIIQAGYGSASGDLYLPSLWQTTKMDTDQAKQTTPEHPATTARMD